jgi:hypothetical protein
MQTEVKPGKDKSALLKMRFRRSDVLPSAELRSNRYKELQKASVLGNEYNYKVDISFETDAGIVSLTTVVWYATDQYVILEDGITVPIQCISRIKI